MARIRAAVFAAWMAMFACGALVAVGGLSPSGASESGRSVRAGEGLLALPQSARGPVSVTLGRGARAYRVHGLQAFNPTQGFRVRFSSGAVSVVSGRGRVRIAVWGFGRRGWLSRTRGSSPLVHGNVVRYARGGLGEWYANGPLGLEQGFTVRSRPRDGQAPLVVSLSLGGNLGARLDHGAVLLSGAGVSLRYDDLLANDARGRALPSWFVLEDRRLAIEVRDRGAAYPVRIDPFVQQGAKLVGSDAVGQPSQGWSVALSADGSTALVGGPNDNSFAGAAWVFARASGTWTQQGPKLVGSGGDAQAAQGYAVALSADGNTALIGGPNDNSSQGAAWVFTRSAGSWTQQGDKLVGSGSTAIAQQGSSVALSADGNTALIGGMSDNNRAGASWVFTRTGATWSQQGAKLVGSSSGSGAQQGESVALSGDGNTALIGGPGDNNSAGSASVFTRTGTTWSQQGANLSGSDSSVGSQQGHSVALSADGNTALIGGQGDDGNLGAAWVFTRAGTSWTQQGAKLVGSGASGAANQGWSVALSGDGNTAAIGGLTDAAGPGATWVFTRSGTSWTQQGAKLVGSGGSPPSSQGRSVALSADGSTALVGGPDDSNGIGATWVFTGNGEQGGGGGGQGAPGVAGELVLGVGQTSATVGADVNPNGGATSYHVEWGPTAKYGSVGADLPSAGPLTGQADQAVAAQLTGLAPGSSYHWRIVARNPVGTTAGGDQTVTTAASGPMPTATFTITPPPASGARTLISAAGSSGNGSPIVSYKWDWTDDGTFGATCTGSDPVAMPVYLQKGTYQVGLQVTNASGQSAFATSTVTVSHVPSGAPPGAGLVAGYGCASLIHNAVCTNHIEWDLIVADALDGGCFEEVPVQPWQNATTICGAVCAGAAAVPAPVAYASPAVATWFRQTDAKTWKTSGRVLINGTIVAPLTQIVGVGSRQGRRFTQRQALVLINEVDDTIYSPSADVSVKSPQQTGLPDTILARNQTVYAKLPVSAPLPTIFGAARDYGRAEDATPANSGPSSDPARGVGLDSHAPDAPDAGNPCEDAQVQRLPTLATFPDPAQAGLTPNIDGFPLAGGPVTVHVTNDRVVVCVDITLPSLAPCPGDDSGGFTLRGTLLADQGGLELQNLRARLPCAVIAGVVFSDVFFNYDANGHHWIAGGTVEAIPGVPLTGVVEFARGQFVHAGASLATAALVTPPIQVTSAGIDVYPDHTTGEVGLGLYPVVPGINRSLLDINGRYGLYWQAQPPYFQLTGSADTFGIPLADGALTVYPDHVHLVGHVEASFYDAFTAKADVLGDVWQLSPLRFNIEADATVSVFDLVDFGGQLLISDNGAAACVEISRSFGLFRFHLHVGAAVNWNPFGIDAMFTGCDVGVERDAAAPARDARAHGEARTDGFTVPVRRGTQYEIFGIDGAGAPPAVELHGPRGETLQARTAGPSLTARYVVLHEAASNSTFVIVNTPAPGTWNVAALPGSTAITAVHYATSLPPVSVNARVSGTGAGRTLSYAIRRIVGQRVRFLERGPGTLRPIAVVPGGGTGKASFSPAPGPGGRRQIVAIVEQNDRPRTELTVADYIAPPPPRLTRPQRLRAVRAHTSVLFAWHRVAGADAYAIAIDASDQRAISTLIARPSFTLIDVAASTSVQITVRALNAHQRGPAASLTAPAAKHRPSRRRGSHTHH